MGTCVRTSGTVESDRGSEAAFAGIAWSGIGRCARCEGRRGAGPLIGVVRSTDVRFWTRPPPPSTPLPAVCINLHHLCEREPSVLRATDAYSRRTEPATERTARDAWSAGDWVVDRSFAEPAASCLGSGPAPGVNHLARPQSPLCVKTHTCICTGPAPAGERAN